MRATTLMIVAALSLALGGCFEGPKGDKGDKGDAGPVGAAGPAGPAGPTGPIGVAGPNGPAGPAGPKGDKGDGGAVAGPGGSGGGASTSDIHVVRGTGAIACDNGEKVVSLVCASGPATTAGSGDSGSCGESIKGVALCVKP